MRLRKEIMFYHRSKNSNHEKPLWSTFQDDSTNVITVALLLHVNDFTTTVRNADIKYQNLNPYSLCHEENPNEGSSYANT